MAAEELRAEHLALASPDPVAAAAWYVAHLGCTVVQASAEEPWVHFLALPGAGGMMVELFRTPRAAVPDYARVDPLQGHLAFATADVAATHARLLAAGATEVTAPSRTDAGTISMLRDPWGLPLQLAGRAEPLGAPG